MGMELVGLLVGCLLGCFQEIDRGYSMMPTDGTLTGMTGRDWFFFGGGFFRCIPFGYFEMGDPTNFISTCWTCPEHVRNHAFSLHFLVCYPCYCAKFLGVTCDIFGWEISWLGLEGTPVLFPFFFEKTWVFFLISGLWGRHFPLFPIFSYFFPFPILQVSFNTSKQPEVSVPKWRSQKRCH